MRARYGTGVTRPAAHRARTGARLGPVDTPDRGPGRRPARDGARSGRSPPATRTRCSPSCSTPSAAPGATAARRWPSSAAPGTPRAPSERLELVAVDGGGAVVGHVLAAPGRLDGQPSEVAGVAPVCVAPAHQGRGAGSALVRELIRLARARALAAPRPPRRARVLRALRLRARRAAGPQLRAGRDGQPALPGAPPPGPRPRTLRGSVLLLLGVTTRRRRRRRPARAAGAGCPRSP